MAAQDDSRRRASEALGLQVLGLLVVAVGVALVCVWAALVVLGVGLTALGVAKELS